jgi:hypothetical protein
VHNLRAKPEAERTYELQRMPSSRTLPLFRFAASGLSPTTLGPSYSKRAPILRGTWLASAALLIALLVDPEDEGEMLLRNVLSRTKPRYDPEDVLGEWTFS